MNNLLLSFAVFNQWPGALLYHLALALLVGLITLLALSRYRTHPAATWARLTQLGGGLLVLQLMGLGLTLLTLAGPPSAQGLIPIGQRALGALLVLALLWALALPPQPSTTLIVGGLGFVILVAVGLSAEQWLTTTKAAGAYNGLPADGWWALGQSLLALIGVGLVLVRRPPLAGVALGVFVLLWLGNTLHYLFPPATYDAPLALQVAESLALTLLALSLTWDTAHVVTPAHAVAATPSFAEGRPEPRSPATPPEAQLTQLRARLAKVAQDLAATRAHEAQQHATLMQTTAELAAAQAEIQRLTLALQIAAAEPLLVPTPVAVEPTTADSDALSSKAVEVVFSNLRDELQNLRQQLTVVPPSTGEKTNKGTAPLAVVAMALPNTSLGHAQANPCHHLGLPGDPETHNAFASPQHRCYAYKNPWKITVAHQDHFCLQGAHAHCPVFTRQETAPRLPIDFVAQPSDPLTPSAWHRLTTLAAPKNSGQ